MFRIGYIFVLLTLSQPLFSQTGNYCALRGTGQAIYLDSNENLNFYDRFSDDDGSNAPNGFTKSSPEGDLSYAVIGAILNASGTMVNSQEKMLSENAAEIILNDSISLVFEQFRNYITVSKILETKGQIIVLSYREKFINTIPFGICSINASKDSSWLIIRKTSNIFDAYLFTSEFSPDTVVQSELPSLFSASFLSMDKKIGTNYWYDLMKCSPSGNFISVFSNEFVNAEYYSVSIKNQIDLLSFDKYSGKIQYLSNLVVHADNFLDDLPHRKYHFWHTGEFSSNDSFFYYAYQKYNSELVDSNYVYSYSIASNSSKLVRSFTINTDNEASNGIFDLKLIKQNELILLSPRLRNNVWGFSFDAILNTNYDNPTYQSQKYFFESAMAWNTKFTYSKYNYIRVRPKINYSCIAEIQFVDLSDYSLANSELKIFIEKLPGSNTFDEVQNLIVEKRMNGLYRYKIVFLNKVANYYESKTGDIIIDIPPKPVADFYTDDTLICAYSSIQFINSTRSTIINPSVGEKWTWTFGDGKSEVFSSLSPNRNDFIEHKYKVPGRYTVTLNYSNGYCDSLLVRKNYIEVVESPNPGFFDVDLFGCAPFKLRFRDTIQYNTSKKMYNFNDGRGWIETPIDSTFVEAMLVLPGRYWVVQSLQGFNGCETKEDSVQVTVHPGISNLDSCNIYYTTWQDVLPYKENWVSIYWKNISPKATRYTILRNNTAISSQTADNAETLGSFDDRAGLSAINAPVYHVMATDSCQNFTKLGLFGSPILVSGSSEKDNEFARLAFSSYQGWNSSNLGIEYSIEKENNGKWISVATQTDTTYFDYRFLEFASNEDKIEQCYRIVGTYNGQITISNILCIPYIPTLYVPTAFSPNDDGLNDVFKPKTWGVSNYFVTIYNRWGEQVYQFDQASSGWDGVDFQAGVYFITVKAINNELKAIYTKQTLTLIR